jgi:hypothetical protein
VLSQSFSAAFWVCCDFSVIPSASRGDQAIVVVMTAAVETPVAHVGEVRPNGPTSVLVDGPLTDVRILQSAAA